MQIKTIKEFLTESIDGHAAVILAHTKLKSHMLKTDEKENKDFHVQKAKDLAHKVRSSPLLGHEQLAHHISGEHLELKSSHPKALDHFHSNLMKVK